MPAYSFQERFVPAVIDGSKPHTIRKRRLKGAAKKGDTLYLYTGLRTKHAKKLREEPCVDVRSICIISNKLKSYICLFDARLTDDQFKLNKKKNYYEFFAPDIDRTILFPSDANRLAWLDGFRPDGSSLEEPGESFQLMMRWWTRNNKMPFFGDIIYWNPKK